MALGATIVRMEASKLFLDQKFSCRAAVGIALCATVLGAAHETKAQASSGKPQGDPMIAMWRRARADADGRFRKGYASIKPRLSYAPLSTRTSDGLPWLDSAWEALLNRKKVFVTHFEKPLTPNTKAQGKMRQVKHRQWTSRFLRAELLPPENNWLTQFYRAPSGDAVAVTSWRSNGFSIRVCDGKQLCVVVRPDAARDVFGHTLMQLLSARKSGQTSISFSDYLPAAYNLNNYAQQLYALVTSEVAKEGSLVGIAIQADGNSLKRINRGRLSLYAGDPVSEIPALPRTFAHEVRYWTDGITVVFVVDKLLAPSAPIKSR